MRKPFALMRPWPFGTAARDPAGGRTLFYASDLVFLFIVVAALFDIALHLIG